MQWESFGRGKVYQYPLQCKRQRVEAQRGDPLFAVNGYVLLNRVWFSDRKP